MPDTVANVRRLLVRELEGFEREIQLFPDDELIWRTLPGVTNSAGTLALHVAGNLRHYVGTVLGGSHYVRDRAAEFSDRSGTRAEVVAGLRAAIDEVNRVLPGLDERALAQLFPEPVGGARIRTGLFLLHLAVHLAHHLGQAGYLRRILTGDAMSSGALSVKAIAAGTP